MKTVVSLAAAVTILSGCEQAWSFSDPTPEQIAFARFICLGDEGYLAAYLAARGQTVADIDLPDFGPEREAYCNHRGYRVAALGADTVLVE